MLFALSILFGGLVGFALGLTGGGGSLLAVPLLVYGLAVPPREAFGISLAAVGATALIGLIPRVAAHQVEIGTGTLFAVAGMVGAPVGTWLASMIPGDVLLALFAVLILIVAWRMWGASQPDRAFSRHTNGAADADGPTCRRTADGRLTLTSGCAVLLLGVGLATGVLSGLFGVGGGFVIVPALVLFSGMPIRRAVATSLLVIVLVSVSGVTSHFVAGSGISLPITGLFVLGGVVGMLLGGDVATRLSTVALQKVFASGIVTVAVFMATKAIL